MHNYKRQSLPSWNLKVGRSHKTQKYLQAQGYMHGINNAARVQRKEGTWLDWQEKVPRKGSI